MDEVLYKDPKTGKETFLPDGMGEKMGLERVEDYTPAELINDEVDSGPEYKPEQPSLKAALGAINDYLDTATDEEKSEEREELIGGLFLKLLTRKYGSFDSSANSIDLAIGVIRERIEAGDLSDEDEHKLDEFARTLLFDGPNSEVYSGLRNQVVTSPGTADANQFGDADEATSEADTTESEESEQPGKASAPKRGKKAKAE